MGLTETGGRRVLVTRPEPGAGATVRRLEALGHNPVILSLTRIEPLPAAFPDPDGFDAVVVTSANALRHAARDLLNPLLALPCFVVGDATADAARRAGFEDVRSASGTVQDLVKLLETTSPPKHLLYIAGRVRTPDTDATLARVAASLAIVETYDAAPLDDAHAALAAIFAEAPPDAVLLHSAQAARVFAAAAVGLPPTQLLLCLSERIAAELSQLPGATILTAREPTESALLELLDR